MFWGFLREQSRPPQRKKTMPGIFGILAKRPDISSKELRDRGVRMASAMRTEPWLESELWAGEGFCGGKVHLGVVRRDTQPEAVPDGGIQAWLDGEVFADDTTTTSSLDPIEVLLCNAHGRLSRLDGAFTLAAFDSAKGELTLVNDRLGLRPLYFTETADWFAYAAEVKSLLAILPRQPDLDRTSLRQFLAADYLFGERTWWTGIELLPPASHWRISTRERETQRYWSFANIEPDPREEGSAIEEFGALWSRAVARRCKPGVSPFLLSGGLDSRLLLAEMSAQGAEVAAFTFGIPGCADLVIARRCSRRLGVPHQSLFLTTENWWHGRAEAIWRTDGLVNGMHLSVAITAPHMHTGNRYTLKNSTGDTLFAASKLGDLGMDWAREPRKLLAKHLNESPFYSREEVVEATLPDCRRYLEGPSSDCFVISQRQRRMILTGALALSAHCEVVNPGVDLSLLHLFLGGLSDAQRAGGRFYHRALLSRYPGLFRNMPRNSTGRGLAEGWHYRVARGARVLASRRLAELPVAWHAARWVDVRRGGYHDYPTFLRRSDVVRTVTCGELLVDEYLDGRALPYLERGWQSAQGSARAVLALLTVETYLRQVADLPWPER